MQKKQILHKNKMYVRMLHIPLRSHENIITTLKQAYKVDVWQILCIGLLYAIMRNLLKLIKVTEIQHY